MATSSKVHLTVEDTGIVKLKPQTEETAVKTSELLQVNHDKHHIFFNDDGFHNHIAHHLLSLYGLGAPASVIEQQYNHNASYQKAAVSLDERIVQDMSDPDLFKKYLGSGKYYRDFLVFWQNEMEKKGWENVLNEYVFGGNERADDMLGRLYAGFLHPLIHLGFGIEFRQPAIIAEALAQASVHSTWMTPYLFKSEAAATEPSSKTVPELIDEIRSDQKLIDSVKFDDGNKIRDGILKRAPEEMIHYAKQWTVSPGELEKKTVEMINSAVYFTAAAQHPPKQVKFDFFYMHSVNCSIFFPTFNAQTWLSEANKIRLLKLKVYTDLAMYVSRGTPPLLLEEVATYVPKKLEAGDAEWKGIFQRLFEHEDDGHAVKLARAVRNAEVMSKEYEGEKWAKIKTFMWEKIGNMVVDSVEDTGNNWARNVGFEEAWANFEDRPRNSSL